MSKHIITDQRDASVLRRLSTRTRSVIEALTKSKLADQALAEVEAEVLAERRQWVAAIEAERAAHPTRRVEAEKAAIAAAQALERAEAAYLAARDKARDTANAASGVDLALLGAVRFYEEKLRAGADSRLADFVFELEQIRDRDLPAALSFGIDVAKADERKAVARNGGTPAPREIALTSNAEDCRAARAAIQTSIERTRGLQLSALSGVEVGQALIGECETLAPALARVALNPPSLTAAEAEVGAPLDFSAHGSRWVVGERHQPDAGERAARAERQQSAIDASARVR